MPTYTHFYDSLDGEYGCVEDREFVSWFIKSLDKGESVSLDYSFIKDSCHGKGYQQEIYYEIINSDEAPYFNSKENPSTAWLNN